MINSLSLIILAFFFFHYIKTFSGYKPQNRGKLRTAMAQFFQKSIRGYAYLNKKIFLFSKNIIRVIFRTKNEGKLFPWSCPILYCLTRPQINKLSKTKGVWCFEHKPIAKPWVLDHQASLLSLPKM